MARRKKDDKALLIFGGAGLGLAALMMSKKKAPPAPPAPTPGPIEAPMVGNTLEELAEMLYEVFEENNSEKASKDPKSSSKEMGDDLESKTVSKTPGDEFGRGQGVLRQVALSKFNPFKEVTSQRNVSTELPVILDAALSVGMAYHIQALEQTRMYEEAFEEDLAWWQKPVYIVGEGLGFFKLPNLSSFEEHWEVSSANLVTFMKTLKAEALANAADANEENNEDGQEPNVLAQIQGEDAIKNHDYWMSYALP